MSFARALVLSTALLGGCAVYDAPPEVSIVGIENGLLADRQAPIVLAFTKPPVQSTVRIEIAKYVLDTEGHLGDEPGAAPETPFTALFTHDPDYGDTGGDAEFSADGSTMTITPNVALPVGGQLVVLVEPGITDATGARTAVRRRVVFGYASNLNCDAPVHTLTSGTYFLLTDVDEPINVQIQLYAALQIDPATGAVKGVFTKAHRNLDGSRCSPPCSSADACRTLPGPPMCVTPSTAASSVDEFPDYVPTPDPPTGFSFTTTGCVVDSDATTSEFAINPVDVEVQMPMVTLRNAALTASFSVDSAGVLRGTGALTSDGVLLGTTDSGKGHGNLTARSLTPEQVPSGVPMP